MSKIRFQISKGSWFRPGASISHMLIVMSCAVALLGFIFPGLIEYFGLHRILVIRETLPFIFGQLVLYQFLHGNFLHIFLNAFFLYQAGPEVESRMSRSEFIIFFLGNTLFVALCLWFLSPSLTIGISGFCMALLAYLYMDLQSTRHSMANQILIMLVINILIGLSGSISFVGHASGAVWGIAWWLKSKRM